MFYAGGMKPTEPAYAVIGYPLHFTLSPTLHNAALAACGLRGRYDALPVAPAALPAAIQRMRDLRLGGYNVTMPHKVAVIPLLDSLTPVARATGAVNTVYWEGDQLCGDNTDVAGFEATVAPSFKEPVDCLLLGTGGAARAVAVALQRLGARAVHVMARNVDAAERLRADLLPGVPGTVVGWTDSPALDACLPTCGWVVNATSVGTDGVTSPLDSKALAALPQTAVVYDLIYQPAQTPLLRAARGRGLNTVNGLPMLIAQAAQAFTRFTGYPAPLEVMHRAVSQDSDVCGEMQR